MYPIAPSLTRELRWSWVMLSRDAACSGVSKRLLSFEGMGKSVPSE